MAVVKICNIARQYSQHILFCHRESVVRGSHNGGLDLYEVTFELLYHKVFESFFLNIGLHSKEASGKEYFVAP